MDSSILDTWVVAEDGIAMGTSVVDGVKFVTVERIIKMGDGAPEMAVMPFARGDELDRLIAALQRARDGEGNAELTNAGTSLSAAAGHSLSMSNVVVVTRHLFHSEGRSVLIGVVVVLLFILFVGGWGAASRGW
jgi:hypothetical protein